MKRTKTMRKNKILKLRKKEIYKKLYNGNHSRQDRNNFYKLNPPLLFMGDYSVGNRNLLSDEFEAIMKIKNRNKSNIGIIHFKFILPSRSSTFLKSIINIFKESFKMITRYILKKFTSIK